MASKKRNFSVGDLVVNRFPLELAFEEKKIQQGEVGLIVGTVSAMEHNISGYDYVVLIGGKEVFFFERELKKYEVRGPKCN